MIYQFLKLSEVEVTPDLPLFADTETVGLYGKVRLLQLMQAGWDKVVLVEWPNSIELQLFIEANHSVWHNSHYDMTCLGERFIPTKFDDTFLLARLAQPRYLTYSLDDVIDRCIGYDPYTKAGLDKKALQKSNWGVPVLSADQKLYAALDVYHMPEVWQKVKGKLDNISYQLDMSAVRKCLDFQCNGMPVDSSRLAAKWKSIEAALAKVPMPINANSWQQVRSWLGVDQSDKQYLSMLALRDGNEKAGNVLKVRQLKRLMSFMTKYDVERVFGKFKPSARSGRFTSDDENLQQIPRKLKEVFGFDDDTPRVLIYSDYAQLELRTICAILGVSLMEKLFRAGEDLHSYVAHILFGDTITKDDRTVTKTFNFNLLYGGSVNMVLSILITYGVWLEEVKANKLKRKWLNLFPEIHKWQQECIAKWRRGSLSSTPLGREYISKLMTDFMNIKNQGAGAEVTKLALHYLAPWLKEYNEGLHDDDQVLLCNVIHDSFILDAPQKPEIYEPVAVKLAECMQEAWFEVSKMMKIKDLPMPVDVKVGKNWGDLEEDEGIIFDFTLEPYKMLEKVQNA